MVPVLLATSACRSDSREATTSASDSDKRGQPDESAANAAPASLLPDGAVPWIDVELDDADVQSLPPELPRIDGDAPRCRSEQLQGSLPKWFRQSEGGGVYGWVDVVHISGGDCFLRGQPGVRLLLAGDDIGVPAQDGGINEEGLRRRVAMVPDEPARLRIDWSPPGCDLPEPDAVELDFADGAGELVVPIVEKARPSCTGGESVGRLRSSVAVSTFEAARRADPPPASPVNAAVVSVTVPQEISAGSTQLEYRVTLTNPTAQEIPLDPCPGYLEELFQVGDMEHEATNTSSLRRLNCRTAPRIAANSFLTFEMQTTLPATVRPGELRVAWRVTGRGVESHPTHHAGATIRVVE